MYGINAGVTVVILSLVLAFVVPAHGATVPSVSTTPSSWLNSSDTSAVPSVSTTVTTPPSGLNSSDSLYSVKCAVCSGGDCETQYDVVNCVSPNHFCINRVQHFTSGHRFVDRKCGNYQTCYQLWLNDSSDKHMCQLPDYLVLNTDLTCIYCCIRDKCNVPIAPDITTWFKPEHKDPE